MPRRPRIQFPGAIYHIITRGDGRRAIFHDDGHYERLTKGLAEETLRSGWEVFAYCWMPNHIHLLLRTPEPNLSAGMQHWLSGYANWYAKRNRRSGHLYQGRFKAYLVENESYLWTLSRYIHLNPCRGGKPLRETPDRWPHSSFPGYVRRSQRKEFVQYDTLHEAWQGECGGKNAAGAYRRFVREGLTGRVENPLKSALGEWVIGSEDFLKRMVALAAKDDAAKRGRVSRRTRALSVQEIIAEVASVHQVEASEYLKFRSRAAGRAMAALLCRRYTQTPLSELSEAFGLGHPDSSANLVRRAKQEEAKSKVYRKRIREVEARLFPKTEEQV